MRAPAASWCRPCSRSGPWSARRSGAQRRAGADARLPSARTDFKQGFTRPGDGGTGVPQAVRLVAVQVFPPTMSIARNPLATRLVIAGSAAAGALYAYLAGED